jgi:hypothetical protein
MNIAIAFMLDIFVSDHAAAASLLESRSKDDGTEPVDGILRNDKHNNVLERRSTRVITALARHSGSDDVFDGLGPLASMKELAR